MLETRDLTVTYGSHRALEGVSTHVDEKEICVILGANGAGKSTLLKAIGGMVAANGATRIAKDGRDLAGLKPSQIVEAGIALVPEGRGIFGDLTVAENLELGAYARRARGSEKRNRDMVLDLFPKLGERKSQIARTMSGGEQQMVAIARALMSNPDILMLDEPSLGLSPILSTELFKALREVRGAGVGILLVEQNARLSLSIADRGYLLENGHLAGEDRADRLANDPAVQKAYLGGAATPAAARQKAGDSYMASYSRSVDATADDGGTIDGLVARAAKIHTAHIEARRASGAVPSAFRRAGAAGNGPRPEPVTNISDLARNADAIMKAHVAAVRAARLGHAPDAAQTPREAASAGGEADTHSERKRRRKVEKLMKKLSKLKGE